MTSEQSKARRLLGSMLLGWGVVAFAEGGVVNIALEDHLVVAPGGSDSGLVVISSEDNTEQYFGYSLALRILPTEGATGEVVFDLEGFIDVDETNLADEWNLIAAYPAPLDPIFTVVWPDGPNGVFINANIDLFNRSSPDFVLSAPNVNDVLAEVVVDASADASGTFLIVSDPVTALSDPNGFMIPFIWTIGTITIDDSPPPSPDLDGDGAVGASDLAILLGDWGPCPTLPADLNGDDIVGSTDLAIFLGFWGTEGGPADFNGDGVVGAQDLANLLGEWGSSTPLCGDLDEDGVVSAADLAVLLGAWTTG